MGWKWRIVSVHFLRGPFDGIEYDTRAKHLRTLETLTDLADDCATEHDRHMLLLAFDIVSRLELVHYA